MLKNVETPGIINLRGSLIVNSSHPAYQTQGKSRLSMNSITTHVLTSLTMAILQLAFVKQAMEHQMV